MSGRGLRRPPGGAARARAAAGVLARTIGLVRQAAQTEALKVLALQLLGAGALLVQYSVGRSFLTEAIGAGRSPRLGDLLPQVAALTVAVITTRVTAAAVPGRSYLVAGLIDRHVTDRVLHVASTVDLATFEDPRFHDHLFRVTDQGIQRPWSVTQQLFQLVGALLFTGALTTVVLSVQPEFLVIGALVYVPVWVALRRSNREHYRMSADMTGVDRERYYLLELLTDPRPAAEIRAYGVGAVLRRRHHELYDRRIAEQFRVARRKMRRTLVSSALSAAAGAVLVGLVLVASSRGEVSLADALVASAALLQVGGQLRTMFAAVAALDEARPYLRDLESLLDLAPDASRAPVDPLPALETLRLSSVGFRYPAGSSDVLEGLDLELRAGEIVGIVGPNGAGKTTLAKILCGLYQPTRGRMTWNGVDVAELGKERLRDSAVMLMQDFARYRLRASQNVGLGDADLHPTDDDVMRAAAKADAARALQKLPAGLATILGVTFPGGTDLSTGQWQRVAIARALFRTRGSLLVLDEPTAALDAEAERLVFESLRAWADGRVVVVVTHRPPPAGSLDRTITMTAPPPPEDPPS